METWGRGARGRVVDRFDALPGQKKKKVLIQRFELSSSNALAPARPFNSFMIRGWLMLEWMNQLPSCWTMVKVALRCSRSKGGSYLNN